jgi:hypothetical protein
MTAYFQDLATFFQKAGAFSSPVVLHVEPDLWAYAQAGSKHDDGASISVKVGSTHFAGLADLDDNLDGFAAAIIRLRDQSAPNVLLAYHLSAWGTGEDPAFSRPSDEHIDMLAARSATFYRSLNSDFDVVFSEFSDRDSGFRKDIYKDGGTSWWTAADFERNLRFLRTFVRLSGKRVVMWQIPFGNSRMLAMNNTWNHYQDNRVEWLLDDPQYAHLSAYIEAGVIALLFGRGADGATCACDANSDGITNPPPINGNTMMSVSSDDDGGFFRLKAGAYYSSGAMNLPK